MYDEKPIDTISISGFKSIKNLVDLPLTPLNVLIGSNGSGKSNFINFFHMLTKMVDGQLQNWVTKEGSADRIVTYGVKETSELKAFIKFGINGYKFSLEPTVSGAFSFKSENLFFDGPYYGPTWTNMGSGHSESDIKSLAENNSSVADYCYKSISNWKIFHFHDTSNTAGVKRLSSLHDNKFLRQDASNLAAFLYNLKDSNPDSYQEIVKVIRLAIPFFDDFDLTPNRLPSEEEQIRLLWKQKNNDYSLWPSQLSDGSLRFICLVTALLQPNYPTTLIIDEPELGLHPYAITLLASLIRSASKKMQIIVSTQSIPLVDEFDVNDLIVVDRNNGHSVFNRFNKEDFSEWAKMYSVGEIWEKNLLGGRPKI